MFRSVLFLAIATLSQIHYTTAFLINGNRATSLVTSLSSTTSLLAKKGKKNTAGKGFGKKTEKVDKPVPNKGNNADLFNIEARATAQQQSTAFTSLDGGSDAIPTISMQPAQTTTSSSQNVEDRTGNILREKYGLRTREEQEAEEAKKKLLADQRKQLNEWNRLADEGEDFDLLQVIPGPILIFIDKFLKAGLAICTILFLLAGVAITVEAGSKATQNPLPQGVDDFISNFVEPNFTPGLGVLLSFSVALGLFASAQLNSAASTYREDK